MDLGHEGGLLGAVLRKEPRPRREGAAPGPACRRPGPENHQTARHRRRLDPEPGHPRTARTVLPAMVGQGTPGPGPAAPAAPAPTTTGTDPPAQRRTRERARRNTRPDPLRPPGRPGGSGRAPRLPAHLRPRRGRAHRAADGPAPRLQGERLRRGRGRGAAAARRPARGHRPLRRAARPGPGPVRGGGRSRRPAPAAASPTPPGTGSASRNSTGSTPS